MWELWLPLLVCAAALMVAIMLYYAARKLLFEGRHQDYPEETDQGPSH